MPRLLLRAAVAIPAGLLLCSCTTFERSPAPGATAGIIYVGTPRVSGRERLVNDRREQEEWLHAQLTGVDQAVFGTNGAVDTRSVSILAAGLQAKTGPDVDLFRVQQQTNVALAREQGSSLAAAERVRTAAANQIAAQLAKKEIDAKEAAAQMAALGITPAALNTTVAPASAPNASGAGAASSNSALTEFLKTGSYSPATGASGAMSGATAAPIDLFRDRLALREEIRNEINENALDETHDLNSHTLYRLTFDATLLPDDDTSAWAVINVSLSPPKKADANLWQTYRAYKERVLNASFLQRVQAIQSYAAQCQKESTLPLFIDCATRQSLNSSTRQKLVLAAQHDTESVSTSFVVALKDIRLLDAQLTRDLNAFRTASSVPTNQRRAPAQMLSVPGNATADFSRALFAVVFRAMLSEVQEEGLGCYFEITSSGAGLGRGTAQQIEPAGYAIALKTPEPRLECAKLSEEEVKAAFSDKVSTFPVEPRVYAVTPKETVQRISDVSSHRAASELVMGLSALAGVGKIDAMLQSIKQNDAFLQALRRQPLVVGFSNQVIASASGKTSPFRCKAEVSDPKADAARCKSDSLAVEAKGAAFGWVLGPTFAISSDCRLPSFRQTLKQQSLTAGVSLPSWWRTVTVTVTGSWHRENASLRSSWAEKNVVLTKSFEVSLPFRASALDGLFAPERMERVPYVEEQYRTKVQVGQAARLLLRGENIWRSTEVFIGAQRADRVRLLPDMQGLVAEFNQILPVWGAAAGGDEAVEISVATSDGFMTVGTAALTKQSSVKPVVVGFGRRFFGDQVTTIHADPPITLFRSLELRASSPTNARLDVKLGDAAAGLAISRDGTEVQMTPKVDDLKLAAGAPIDLFLVMTSDRALGPEVLPIVNSAIYYPRSGDAVAAAAWATAGAGLRSIKLTLPPGAKEAFSSAATGAVRLLAVATTGNGLKVKLDSPACVVNGKSCTLPLSPAGQIDSQTAAALKSGDFTLEIQLDGDDSPEVSPRTLAGK